MTNEISKTQMVVRMKSGVEIWIDEDKAGNVMNYLEVQKTGFGRVEGRLINLVDIEGVYFPQDLEELKKTKRGQWKCKYGNWHSKDDTCQCGQNIIATKNEFTQTPEQREKAREAIDKLRSELNGKYEMPKM